MSLIVVSPCFMETKAVGDVLSLLVAMGVYSG
jgi:hypothetical protein